MDNISAAARPYGIAAFMQAKEEGKLREWSEMLELVARVTADPIMRGLVASPKVSDEQVAQIIIDVCGDALSETGQNLVRLLAENERLDIVDEIAAVYAEQRAEAEGLSHIDVTSAFELSDEQRKAIGESMSKRLGTKVDMNVKVDDALIGGVIIRAGDLVIDASLRGRLEQLGQILR
ncbi:MAG: F0F1 ATP synthase subunit delta [Gammaproteobacteria bacterium]|nr:F0F1 ATP synthase subunit delta [Gammaproteobacteria bacterium]